MGSSGDGNFFGMELAYQKTLPELNNVPQYNGNISAASWSSAQDSVPRAYSYQYDKGSRLQAAQHYEKAAGWDAVGAYSVPEIDYDHNGNIEKLVRNDGTGSSMDFLDYAYEGNLLKIVTDAGDIEKGFKDGNLVGEDYGYDANGNLAFYKNLGIDTIYYYHTNHPDSIVFTNGMAIHYVYDATGNKLVQKVYASGQTAPVAVTTYAGEFVYYNGQLQLVHHEEGRLVPKAAGGFAYEYDLTDHLGNTRVTFTSEPATEVAVASMESENAGTEEAQFLKLADTRTNTVEAIDHTGTAETPEVIRLNGYRNVTDGPGKTLRVMPGDKVTIAVYAKYLDMRRANDKTTAAALLSAVMQAAGGAIVPGDPAQAVLAPSSMPTGAMAGLGTAGTAPPKAFLNYYLFDNNFNEIDAGFVQVSEAAAVTAENVDGAHEKLVMEVNVTEPGYLFTNLSHNAPENVEVYFDDYTVTHEHGPIVQVQDFYPYGLAFNGNIKDHAVLNKYLYQGKERLDSLGWYDFHARMYSPALGRFLGVDPQNQFASPFVGMGNNPTVMVDPDGEFAVLIGLGVGLVAGYISGRAAGVRGWDLAGYTFANGVIGAVSAGIGSAVGSSVSTAVGTGFWAGAAGGAAGGFIGGAGTAAFSGDFHPVTIAALHFSNENPRFIATLLLITILMHIRVKSINFPIPRQVLCIFR